MQKMHESKISSKYLFHFTKSAEILVSILKNGFYPMTAIEDISFMLPNYKEAKVGIPMVCFTDIPLSESEIHREEYGEFGIGLTKEWGMKNGLNPISYVVKGSEMYNSFNHMQFIAKDNAVLLDQENDTDTHVLNMMEAFMDYTGYLKEYTSDMDMNKKPFYDEREWRYLPPFKEPEVGMDGLCNRLDISIVNDKQKRMDLNEKMKAKYTLRFDIDDMMPGSKLIIFDFASICLTLKI